MSEVDELLGPISQFEDFQETYEKFRRIYEEFKVLVSNGIDLETVDTEMVSNQGMGASDVNFKTRSRFKIADRKKYVSLSKHGSMVDVTVKRSRDNLIYF